MNNTTCNRCSKPFADFGALVFSPPFVQEYFVENCNDVRYKHNVEKMHICIECWESLKNWMIPKTEAKLAEPVVVEIAAAPVEPIAA